ncbi:MAG: DoxX family protein [Bacteroidia bacterium]|nr:DoxX family protein [Bacteroidia bacterium]
MDFINPFSKNSENQRLDLALLVLRLCVGGLMAINHGWGKMLRLFGDEPIKFADVFGFGVTTSLGLAVFSELLCAILLVLGLFTRAATIPLIITMAVAAFHIHWADPFGDKEGALMFLLPYIALLLTGAGRYSLDHQFFGRS